MSTTALMPSEAVGSPEARRRLADALIAKAKSHGVAVTEEAVAKRYGGGYYDMDRKRIAVSPGSYDTDVGVSTLAHEVGHAAFDREMLGKLIQDPVLRVAADAAPVFGTMIGLVARGNLATRLGLAVGTTAALQLPTLASEAMASVRGHQFLEEGGASQELLDLHKKEMLGAFGSYLAPAAKRLIVPSIAAVAAHHIAPG